MNRPHGIQFVRESIDGNEKLEENKFKDGNNDEDEMLNYVLKSASNWKHDKRIHSDSAKIGKDGTKSEIHKLELNPFFKNGGTGLPSEDPSNSDSASNKISRELYCVGDGGKSWRTGQAGKNRKNMLFKKYRENFASEKNSEFGLEDRSIYSAFWSKKKLENIGDKKVNDASGDVENRPKDWKIRKMSKSCYDGNEYLDRHENPIIDNKFRNHKENIVKDSKYEGVIERLYRKYDNNEIKSNGIQSKTKNEESSESFHNNADYKNYSCNDNDERLKKNTDDIWSKGDNMKNCDNTAVSSGYRGTVERISQHKNYPISPCVNDHNEMINDSEVMQLKADDQSKFKFDDNEYLDSLDRNELFSLLLKFRLDGDNHKHDKLEKYISSKYQGSCGKNTLESCSSNGSCISNFSRSSKNFSRNNRDDLSKMNTLKNSERFHRSFREKGKNLQLKFQDEDSADAIGLLKMEKLRNSYDFDRFHKKHLLRGSKLNIEDDDDYDFISDIHKKVKDKKEVIKKSRLHLLNTSKKFCSYCIESMPENSEFRRNVLSLSQNAYVIFQKYEESISPYNFSIVPMIHCCSITNLDLEVVEEIRNYQKSITLYLDTLNLSPIFIETVPNYLQNKDMYFLGGGRHTKIECLPIPYDLLQQAKTFFRKAFDECDVEWSQHKKVIEIPKSKKIHECIPKTIPYIHVDFSLDGGLAHVIESGSEFPVKLGRDVVLGIMGKDVVYKEFDNKSEFIKVRSNIRREFEKFDWVART